MAPRGTQEGSKRAQRGAQQGPNRAFWGAQEGKLAEKNPQPLCLLGPPLSGPSGDPLGACACPLEAPWGLRCYAAFCYTACCYTSLINANLLSIFSGWAGGIREASRIYHCRFRHIESESVFSDLNAHLRRAGGSSLALSKTSSTTRRTETYCLDGRFATILLSPAKPC